MARSFEVRFGVLANDGARSGAFSIWAPNKKSELYVAVRGTGGLVKAAIHYEGQGSSPRHCGFSSEAVRQLQDRSAPLNRSRHFVEFTGETKAPGVIVECRICIPRSGLRIVPAPNGAEKVTWLPAPPHGSMLDVSLTVAPAETAIDWEHQRQIGTYKLADGRLADSRRVFVLYRETSDSDLDEALRDAAANFRADGAKLASGRESHRLLLFDKHPHGYLVMADIAADAVIPTSVDGSESLGRRGVPWPAAPAASK